MLLIFKNIISIYLFATLSLPGFFAAFVQRVCLLYSEMRLSEASFAIYLLQPIHLICENA